MYQQHFGLRELPFTLTPNTHFYLNLPTHQEAFNLIMVAMGNGDGFVKIVGEVGTGKTLLCRKVLNALTDEVADDKGGSRDKGSSSDSADLSDKPVLQSSSDKSSFSNNSSVSSLKNDSKYVSAYIPNPNLTPDGFRMNFARELGVAMEGLKGSYDLLERLNHRLLELAANNKQVVLIVDEAQTMPEETIEALRLLTNLETETSKLFQVVLFGQPELDELLNRRSLRQLKQRITFSYQLKLLDQEGTGQYIQHRIALAGYNGMPIFDQKSMKLLHKASVGTPRLINILSHKTLMSAYGKGDRQVQSEHVRLAAADTEGVSLPSSLAAPVKTGLIVLLSIAVIGLSAGLLLDKGLMP